MNLAIVTPWFGGARLSGPGWKTRRLAGAFAASGHDVDVLATASSPEGPWDRSDLPLGHALEDGYRVRRFPVDRREAAAFDRADASLRLQTPRSARTSFPPELAAGYAENVRSQALLEWLRDGCSDRDAILFTPYRWQPILEGIPLVAERAFLAPCLEREAYAYLPAVAKAVHAVSGLCFGNEHEYRLAQHLFGPGIREKSTVIGEWLEEPPPVRAGAAAGSLARLDRFALYLGPRDETRNVGLLLEAFLAYRKQMPRTRLNLVLAGSGDESYADEQAGVFDLGPLGDAERGALLETALVMIEPAYLGDPALVLEACARGCPVAVNADGPWPAAFSEASAGERSDDTWRAATKAEWLRVFEAVDRTDSVDRERRGRAMRRYFERNGSAAGAVRRYEAVFERLESTVAPAPVRHIIASDDLTDDAVRRGLAFAKFSQYAGIPAVPAVGADAGAGATVVVHSARAEDLRGALLSAAAIRSIVYDAAASAQSEREAFEVVTAAESAAGTSEAAVQFLVDAGARNVREIPFVCGTQCWDVPSDFETARLLDDGKINCVYAGRIDGNAGVDRLVTAFAFLLSFEVDARLVICAALDEENGVLARVRTVIEESGLAARVVFVSSSSPSRLAAVYRAANIFWTLGITATSLSPLVDAMWFDVPIIAYASAPCAELLGQAGLMVRDVADARTIAGLAKILIGDAALRGQVLEMQRLRREELSYDRSAGANLARELFGIQTLEATRP